MSLAEQMKLAGKPFGGKQAKPFGKKEEKGESKAEEKKKHASMGPRVVDLVDRAAEAMHTGAEGLRGRVRDNPLTALATGVAAGSVVRGTAGRVADYYHEKKKHSKKASYDAHGVNQALHSAIRSGAPIGQVARAGVEEMRNAVKSAPLTALATGVAAGSVVRGTAGRVADYYHEKKKHASLAEQMKVAVIGGAIGGGLAAGAIEAFLRKNPKMLSHVGLTGEHIPKGLAGLGMVAGGGLEYAADKQRREG
jgi:hypothetical protein